MKRTIIKIDQEKCNGCGKCVTGCHEGALKMIHGKAVLTSEHFCDGLGACIGDCPVGAIVLEEREAAAFDENAVQKQMGLNHIKPVFSAPTMLYKNVDSHQFPIQLHLINPQNPLFKQADLLIAADCSAFVSSDFRSKVLKGRKLAIACPKLDSNKERYLEKLVALMDSANIQSISVLMMEVPCCSSLLGLVKQARDLAKNKLPIQVEIMTSQGQIKSEQIIPV